ncbi:MAG TPA: SPFH domain-containing protein [Patescibacteria group bacterium]|nr:SPFH domain-containing protein [Patescibacteria group bacterium]
MPTSRDIVNSFLGAFRRPRTVSWERQEDLSPMIWRLPDEGHPDVGSINRVMLREHEKAALYKAGTYDNVFSQGEHDLPKDIDEVVFVDISPRTRPFGIPRFQGPETKDGLRFGFSGRVTFRVNEDVVDVANFVNKVVSGRASVSDEDIVGWMREGPLKSVFKDIVKERTYEEFRHMDRDEMMMELEAKLGMELSDNGMELLSIEILNFSDPE